MKKLFIVLFAIMMATAAHAQFYAGGSLGFSSNGNSKSSVFSFQPEVGYVINDQFAVGATLELTAFTGGNTIGFAPYARYNFLKIGKVSIFADGSFMFSKTKNADAVWEIGIYPGLSLPLNEKLSLVAHVGELSYNSGNVFTLGIDNTISTGLYYNF